MALKPQLSFSSGELDPILHDRVTLDRFQNGLATARNVMVGKQGSILSRFGRYNFVKARYTGSPIKIFCPPNSKLIMEFGYDINNPFTEYCRLYHNSGTLLHTYERSSDFYFTKENLDKLQFEYSKDNVYVFEGKDNPSLLLKIRIAEPYSSNTGLGVIPQLSWPGGAFAYSFLTNTSGYRIDYAVSIVINGEEYIHQIVSDVLLKKPIAVTEKTDLTIDIIAGAVVPDSYQEIRIYQRPFEGAAFGFLGRTTNFFISGGRVKAKFTDVGADPDYSNGLQSDIVKSYIDTSIVAGQAGYGTGAIYQQRLILGNIIGRDSEAILASRPGFQSNFYTDYPVTIDSALNFKAGTSGKATVLRMIDNNGLNVFTSVGIFTSVGVLNPDNLILERKGNWVIDENIPPLALPGGLFFVEKSTGAIKQLIYSQELSAYDSIDQSIFSSHLFKNRTIKSWAHQDGLAPLVIVTFSDGTFAIFTYSFEHQMKAWTRCDSSYPVEQVAGTGDADLSFFVINKNGDRYIEGTIPRIISPEVYATNPEAKLLAYCAFMDGVKIKVDLLNDNLFEGESFTLIPVVQNDWEGQLTLKCGTSGLFTNPGNGEVGTIFRFFNLKDKSKLDLEIISRTNDNEVVVQPTEEFPEEYSEDFRLYLTHTKVDGIEHLEGELISIISDGDVLSSPYNDSEEEGETFSVVQNGEIDLPDDFRSAITIVGRPIVADIKTLNISTAEQSPTMIESLNVNKLYTRIFESRGIYVDNQFPEEKVEETDGHSVKGMQPLDEYYVPNNTNIIGNRSKPATSKRIEVTIPGSWENNGQMAMRQVDPLHFEILSIIADVEILTRSDR